MHVTHLYSGEDGRSHFLERDVPEREFLPTLELRFGTVLDAFQSPHPAPRRQFVIVLEGSMEIECAGGAFRLGPGEVMLADDTSGEGHVTRPVGLLRTAVAPLPDSVEIDAWPPVEA